MLFTTAACALHTAVSAKVCLVMTEEFTSSMGACSGADMHIYRCTGRWMQPHPSGIASSLYSSDGADLDSAGVRWVLRCLLALSDRGHVRQLFRHINNTVQSNRLALQHGIVTVLT